MMINFFWLLIIKSMYVINEIDECYNIIFGPKQPFIEVAVA